MQRNSFTLLELLIVVGLMGFIASLGTFGYTSYTQRARDTRRKIDMQELRSALELYRSNNADGAYPSSSEYGSGTASVLVPIYLRSLPLDPAGDAYGYTPSPSGCNNSATFCISYTLSTTLETTGSTYNVYPNSLN